jgi:hypothetical protein
MVVMVVLVAMMMVVVVVMVVVIVVVMVVVVVVAFIDYKLVHNEEMSHTVKSVCQGRAYPCPTSIEII